MFLIPDFVVYSAIFHLSFMGLWCSRHRIYIDPALFLLFLPQAVMYVIFDVLNITVEARAAYVRLSLFLIPFLFSSVLTFEYWRRRR